MWRKTTSTVRVRIHFHCYTWLCPGLCNLDFQSLLNYADISDGVWVCFLEAFQDNTCETSIEIRGSADQSQAYGGTRCLLG